MSSEKLKPCPFCGSVATDLITEAYCSNPNCAISGQGFYVAEWNKRPLEEKLKKAIDTLNEAVKFSEDKNLNRHVITARMKEAQKSVIKLLGIATAK